MAIPPTDSNSPQGGPAAKRGDLVGLWLSPLAVLSAALAITVWGWRVAERSSGEIARSEFLRHTEVVVRRLQDRVSDCEYILLGGAGLFSASEDVSRAEWRRYVEALHPEVELAGIQGVGYAVRVPAAELPAHLAQVRGEGYPDYAIRPADPRPEYTSIIYLEPFTGRNLRAFGYDMATEPIRRQAMERARDSGQPAISGRVTLVQEIPGQPMQWGFLVYVPVYANDRPHDTVADRRADLRGYVYSPFRAGDFFDYILAAEAGAVTVEVYDAEETGAAHPIYDSREGAGHRPPPADFRPAYAETARVGVLGRTWTVLFHSRPEFEASQPRSLARLTLGIGLLCSVLATGITAVLAARNRALHQVAQMANALRKARDELESRVRDRTRELSQANEALGQDIEVRKTIESELASVSAHYRLLLNVATDGIHVLDGEGRIVEWSESFRAMLGYEPGEMAHLTVKDWDAQMPQADLLARIQELISRPAVFQTVHRRKDGTRYPVEINASGIDLAQRKYLYCSARDITERLKAEEAARESERRFGVMADAAPVLIWVAGPDQQRTYFNKTWLAFTGRSLEQEMGGGWMASVHPDDLLRCREVYDAAFAGRRQFEFEYRLRRRDGDYRWIIAHGVPRFEPDGAFAGFIGTCIDITEKRQAEDRLRLQGAAMGAAASSIVITGVDGTIQWVNDAFTRASGYTAEEAVGRRPAILKSGLHSQDFYRRMWSTILQGRVWRGEVRNKRKNGTLYDEELTITPVHDQEGKVAHFIAIKSDITDRKQAEESLRAASVYARSLIEASLDPLVTISVSGMITDVNEASVQATGVPREQLIGTDFSNYFTEPAKAREGYQRVFAEGQVRDYPLAIRHQSGRVIDVLYNASVYRDVHGNVLGVFAAARDVTERKRLLEQSVQDARAKTDLLREVNHRVTNNLTSILGLIFSEVSNLGDQDRPLIKPVLDRLGQRIRGLLDAHRMLSDHKWAPVRLDRLAEQVIRAAIAADPGRHAAELQAKPSEVLVSPRQASNLALILNELATNTIKYAPAGAPGPIRIAVAVDTAGDFITLCYRDNGPGFPDEVVDGRRANIGLHLVRQLATETLRGELTLANRDGAEVRLRIRMEEKTRT